MRIVVTGAGGFVGAALIRELVSRGYDDIVGLMHHKGSENWYEGVNYVEGEVTDRSQMESVLHDAEVVVHCAALVQDYGRYAKFRRINVDGTEVVARACVDSVKRFVLLGHIPYGGTRMSGYTQSKWEAEQLVLQMFHDFGFPAVVIRPGNVFGPHAGTWVVRVVEALRNKRIALINRGSGIFLHTYIDNLVDAVIASFTADSVCGECISVTDGDHSVSWKQYFDDLASILSVEPVTRSLSKPTALLVAYAALFGSRFTGKPPLVTPMAVNIFANTQQVSIEKAQKLLGYEPQVNYAEGMQHVAEWLKTRYP